MQSPLSKEIRLKYRHLIGTKQGHWRVIGPIKRNKRGVLVIKRKCRCGVKKFESVYQIKRVLKCRKCSFKHGMSKTKTYYIWYTMRQRCAGHNISKNKCYIGKKVCSRWLNFSNFFADMGECPKGFSIDRINPNLGYRPSNCRWLKLSEQSARRSCVRRFEVDGKLLNMKEISKLYNINYGTLHSRVWKWKWAHPLFKASRTAAHHHQMVSLK